MSKDCIVTMIGNYANTIGKDYAVNVSRDCATTNYDFQLG